MAAEIDAEVARLINDAQKTAEKVIMENRLLLNKIAKTLIEKETIEKDEFEKMMAGGENKETPKPNTLKNSKKKNSSPS
jgi:cell division protease FtsH